MFWLAGLARCLLLSTVLMRCGVRMGQRGAAAENNTTQFALC